MRILKTTVILAALFLCGCAVSSLPQTTVDASNLDPSAGKTALDVQARGLRTQIIERKQKITVFEVMLTDVERRAARAQIPLTYLPDTNLAAQAAPQRANTNDRLSVAIKPSLAAAATAKAPMKKRPEKKKRNRRK